MELLPLRVDDLCTRDQFEALVARMGGEPLAAQSEVVRDTRTRLQVSLASDQREAWLSHADALSDAGALREEAAVRAALALGVGLGAALTRCGDAPAAAVVETASGVIGALLGSRLNARDADAAARAALDAVQRLPAP